MASGRGVVCNPHHNPRKLLSGAEVGYGVDKPMLASELSHLRGARSGIQTQPSPLGPLNFVLHRTWQLVMAHCNSS